jgi:hypothetical protein
MANPEHLAKLKEGVPAWNHWRAMHPALLGGNPSVDLRGSDLYHARLGLADFHQANLSDADLHCADLVEATFAGADLRRANLTKAYLGFTVFSNADLTGAIGLETCFHVGPSHLDINTLQRSKDLPLPFLRGCGLPETLIEYLPSLLKQPIQFYSCFISYSTKDQEFAERLHADLQNKGVRCWFAPHNVQAGRKLHEQIDEAIRVYDRLLLILSENSMNSEWVKTEIAHARQKEIVQGRQVLFPISLVPFNVIRDWKCFDADTGKDSAREIREYFIPDFSNWKDHDSYKTAFERLVKDLKATGS